MKKTLCLVLGVLAMLMLPGRNAQAQGTVTGGVNLSVRTLDRALLDSAWLYAAVPGVDYFVDSAHLSDSYTGSALPLDSLTTRCELTIVDGYNIAGPADTGVYHNCFVVTRDVNNRYYVLAGGTQIDLGVFQALPLFLGGDTINNAGFPMTSDGNILMGTPAVIVDNDSWEYTTMNVAINWANITMSVNQLQFMDTVRLENSVNINRTFTVDQAGYPLVNNVAGSQAVKVNGDNELTWDGNIANILAGEGSGQLFMLTANSKLNISNVSATAAGPVVGLGNTSKLVATGSTFATTDASGAVVVVSDSSDAVIDVVNFNGGNSAVLLSEGSHGVLHVLANTVENRMSGYSQPINAYAYGNGANAHRMYARTLRQVADSVAGDTVFLVMSMPAGVKDTIASPVVLQLGNYAVADTIRIENAVGPVSVEGGNVEAIACSTNDAPLALNVDSLGYLNPGFHTVIINDGRYVAIDQIAGASVSIRGGKYGERYDAYVAPRHTFVANTESDAALFPWMITEGYVVTWMNYDFLGNDTTILYNNANNIISPILSEPRYANTNHSDPDTIFIAWWADPQFTTPWDFVRDTLSGNDTLWAQWHLFNPATEAYFYVRHNRIGIDALDTISDTVTYFANIGGSDTIYPINYAYFTPTVTMVVLNPIVADTVVNIDYVRDTFQLTWNLRGGEFGDGHPLVEHIAWGTLLDYTSEPSRCGYTFAGWVNNLEYMPPYDLTIMAAWEHTVYPLTWEHADDTVVYTSEPIDMVRATFTHDGVTDTAILHFFNHGDGIMYDLPLRAGIYTVTARPQDTVFLLGDSVKSFTVDRARVAVGEFEVAKEKFYDGNDTAEIITMAELGGVLGNDEVFLGNVYAKFSDATVGEGKSIIVYYGIAGVNVANYKLDTNAWLAATDGAIIMPFNVNEDTAASGIAVNAYGYCAGSDTIRYFLQDGSGIPDEYLLVFSDDAVAQGFDNTVGWQALDAANPGIILIDVPATAASGLYNAMLFFRDHNHPTLISDTSFIGFVVNLPETYTMPLFSDVIALVDTCHCFTDIHWFHSTDGGATWTEVTEAQGKYYYQEEGGLTGQYRVAAKMNGVAIFTCPQTDVTTLIVDGTQAASVKVYPNPAVETATVSISNSDADIHTLRVMSIVGAEMENTTFSGDSYDLDLRGYSNGSYTVSVDGIVVRVIKK